VLASSETNEPMKTLQTLESKDAADLRLTQATSPKVSSSNLGETSNRRHLKQKVRRAKMYTSIDPEKAKKKIKQSLQGINFSFDLHPQRYVAH